MTDTKGFRGVIASVVTPSQKDLGPDQERRIRRFSEVIQRVGDEGRRIYLCHIPLIAQVPISLPLAET